MPTGAKPSPGGGLLPDVPTRSVPASSEPTPPPDPPSTSTPPRACAGACTGSATARRSPGRSGTGGSRSVTGGRTTCTSFAATTMCASTPWTRGATGPSPPRSSRPTSRAPACPRRRGRRRRPRPERWVGRPAPDHRDRGRRYHQSGPPGWLPISRAPRSGVGRMGARSKRHRPPVGRWKQCRLKCCHDATAPRADDLRGAPPRRPGALTDTRQG